jgi:hypothetical protein
MRPGSLLAPRTQGVSLGGPPVTGVGSLLILALLAGCGSPTSATRFTVMTAEASPEDVAATARVIQARFDHWAPSDSSRVDTTINGNRIDFHFRGTTPHPTEIVYLGSTPGVFKLASGDAPKLAWVSDLNFHSARCVDAELGGLEVVNLEVDLRAAAGARLAAYTRQNLGKVVVATWDNQVIGQGTISSEFGPHFVTTLQEDEHTRMRCTIIETGRLPVAIASYHLELASTS